MDAGIYSEITNDAYHSGPGDSKSGLDLINRSPMHYWARKTAANDNEPTAAQAIGTAFHSRLLEPELFARSYVVAPKIDKRTNAGKAEWEAFQTLHAGKEYIDQATSDQLEGMAAAVAAHPAGNALMNGEVGSPELSVYWRDEETGLLLRCRPDWWRIDGIIVDVKTTDDASPEEFSRSVAKWRYHVQAAFYLDGITAAIKQSGEPLKIPTAFVFLVVEKKAPYAVQPYILDDESIELGRAAYRANLRTLARCMEANEWPAYGDTIQRISVPAWYAAKHSEVSK